MKINITLECDDLKGYIKSMLAQKGLRPKGDLVFQALHSDETMAEPVWIKSYNAQIEVECEPAPYPDACPLCQTTDAAPVAEPKEVPPMIHEVPPPEDDEPEPEPEHRLDEELGESMEPPEYDEPEAKKDGGASIRSVLSISDNIRATREREQASRKRTPQRMPGESARPPRGGK